MISSARSTARARAETRMVHRREREYEHQLKWNDQVRYYKTCEKLTNKFDEWTSPRYYETSNKRFEQLKTRRQNEERLVERRQRLKKLFDEEDRTYNIELMVRNRDKYAIKKPAVDVKASVLRDLKLEEEERRKREVEMALYHQWRTNNPIVREHERKRALNELKLTWLDQQIEKRLERERSEEECRKQIEERKKWLKAEREKEKEMQRELTEKKERLRVDLAKQIEELSVKEEESERLRVEEEKRERELLEVRRLEEERVEGVRDAKRRELALENLKMHRLRLKQKAEDVRVSVENDKAFVRRMLDAELAERIEDERKKDAVKTTMREFLRFAREQEDLERKRRQHFDFVFDSEAKAVWERQRAVWDEEERGRSELLRGVLDEIKVQVEEKAKKNREQQKCVLEERAKTLRHLEECDEDIRKHDEEEKRRRIEWQREVDLQFEEKRVKEAQLRSLHCKEQDLELELLRKEERRLQKEIVELQRRQGPVRHARSRILF